jgi:MFS family permease
MGKRRRAAQTFIMSPSNERRGPLSGEQRGLTIGLLLAVTLVAFEALAVATVMPAAKEDLGGIRLYGWTFSGFLLASLVGITWAGQEADRHGPARPLAAGMTLFGIGLLVGGLAPSMAVLVAGRTVQGLGAGALPAVAYVAIGRGYDEHQRPRMLALLATAWIVPGLAGPGIASAVAEYLDWRAVFLGLVPFLPLAGLLTLPPLRRLGAPDSEPGPARTWMALRLALGAALALGGASSGSVVIAAVLAPVGGAIGLPALRRLLPPGTLRARAGAPAAIAGMGLANLAFFGAEAYIPLTLKTLRGQSTLVAGVALTAATLSWTTGAWIQERLAGRVAPRRIARVGLLLIAAGIGCTSLVLWDAIPALAVAPAWGIAGVGMGMAYPTFSLTVLAQATAGQEGAASSALKLNEVLGASAGIGIGGVLVAAGENGGWESSAVLATFGVAAAGALLATLVARGLPATSRATVGDAASGRVAVAAEAAT